MRCSYPKKTYKFADSPLWRQALQGGVRCGADLCTLGATQVPGVLKLRCQSVFVILWYQKAIRLMVDQLVETGVLCGYHNTLQSHRFQARVGQVVNS